MNAKWEYELMLVCSDAEDGADIYRLVEDYAKLNNVIWDDEPSIYKSAVFLYEAEAYIVPRAKVPKFVRYVCRWFAEAIVSDAQDEDERLIHATVTVNSVAALCRNTFELTVSWRDHEYTLQQFVVPRHGDEAFYGWDDGEENKEGGKK